MYLAGIMFVLDIADFLKGQPFFGDLPADVIHGLGEHSDYRRLDAGEVLFREGDPGLHLFWVLDGEVAISAAGAGGASQPINTMRTGDLFGEVSLIDDRPRTATATATVPTVLIAIEGETLSAYMEKQPAFAVRFARLMCDRVRRMGELLAQRS